MKPLQLIAVILIAIICNAAIADAVDCGINNRNENCLDVFTSKPTNLPKCYCPELCAKEENFENNLESLKHNCASGELHQDGCGSCLSCAKALGEACGGQFNVLGSCAGGLSCLVDIPKTKSSRTSVRRRAENAATGICVTDRSSECPTASVSSSAFSGSKLCRPGRRGIIAEALYCPTQREETRCESPTQTKVQAPAFPNLFEVISGGL